MMTPPLPPIPTDNLYKFQALSGLALLILCLLMVGYMRIEIPAKRSECNVEAQIIIIDMERLLVNIKTHTVNLPSAQEKAYELKKRTVQAHGHFDEFSQLETWQDVLRVIYLIVGIIGGYLIDTGFRRWKERVQNYQDKILKKQAESAS